MSSARHHGGKFTAGLFLRLIWTGVLSFVIMSNFTALTVSAQVTITIFDESGTAIDSSSGAVKVGSKIRVRCTFPALSTLTRLNTTFYLYKMHFSILKVNTIGDGSQVETQDGMSCNLLTTPPSFITGNHTFRYVLINETVCTLTHFDVIVIPKTTTFGRYDCNLGFWGFKVGQSHYSKALVTYTEPTTPRLTSIGNKLAYKEGEDMYFRCLSSAKPPPKLQITSETFEISPDQWKHKPALQLITKYDPLTTSEITWNHTAERHIDGSQLRCTINQHPSRSESQQELTLTVYYGPDDADPTDITWFIELEDKLNITCEFNASGWIEYTWYDSLNNVISTNQTLSFDKGDNFQAIGNKKSTYFWCIGKNLLFNNHEGSHKYRVNISKETLPTTERTRQKAFAFHGNSLQTIAAIAAGICLIIGLVFFTTIMCRKSPRRHQQPELRQASINPLVARKASDMTSYSVPGGDNENTSQSSHGKSSHKSSLKSNRSSRGSSRRGKRKISKKEHSDAISEEM